MKNILIIISLFIFSCKTQLKDNSDHMPLYVVESHTQDFEGSTCPENHQDSIIPIVYGYPSEELFAKSDSGLIALGGCELGEENYFCKIHKIRF